MYSKLQAFVRVLLCLIISTPIDRVPAEFYLCVKCRGMCSICLDKRKRDTDIRCHQCYRLFHSSCLER